MLKKEMRKILENFYVFSKLSTSLLLLISLIGVLYLLYKNFNEERLSNENRISSKEELNSNIDKNSELINNLSEEIKIYQAALEEIKKNIKSIASQDNQKNLLDINKNIEQLNDNFNFLSKEISELKKISFINPYEDENKNSNIINSSTNDIIDLILVKYENNIDFNKELEYLNKISNKRDVTSIEKLYVLANENFKGYEFLHNIFNQEIDIYLKNMINKNQNSFFSRIILPYIEISPTSENNINSDSISKIKKINIDINNKKLEDALYKLKTIKNYENYFEITILEINKLLIFRNELYKFK